MLNPVAVRPRRGDLKAGEVPCDYCTAKCCGYFALPIETPTDWQDFEYVRWYVLHGRTSIFTEDDVWFLCVHSVCQHVQPDNRCGIYDHRPDICREYSHATCEYEDDGLYERFFDVPQQIYEYAEAMLGPKAGTPLRSPEPPLLPLLG